MKLIQIPRGKARARRE